MDGKAFLDRKSWRKKRKERFTKGRYFGGQVEETPDSMPVASSSRFFNIAGASASGDDRPPPGLKGREIGLWFRDRHKRRKAEGREVINVIPLTIPKEREERIKSLLDSISSSNPQRLNFDLTTGLEDDISENIYPREYVNMVKVSFYEKLEDNISPRNTYRLLDNMEINHFLRKEHNELQNNRMYVNMLNFRQKLPTYKKRDEILKLINNNQVIVLSGETGCGKSTQVPQLILEEACKHSYGSQINICVTQPRRIAATSLAHRVASERAERIGNSVGYSIRLESKTPRLHGSITYVTTGILLREMENAPGLMKHSHIILDEVHERDANIDLTLICIKKIIQKRKNLKVILMSATIDAEKLSAYFDNCPCIHIPGLAYPVADYYLEDALQVTGFQLNEPDIRRSHKRRFLNMAKKDQMHRIEVGPFLTSISAKYDPSVIETLKNYESENINFELIVELLKYLISKGDGAILIFLPGMGDISKMIRLLDESREFPPNRYDIYPLHSKLPTLDQSRIFQRPPEGVRKIVVATNIAETSITIDDVVYVIDCGKIKLTGYNPDDGISSLMPEWVSESNLRQRRGRAGRVQAGECWHMISSYRRSKLLERQLPELCRASLIEPVLAVKRLRLGGAEQVLVGSPDPPDVRSIEKAVKELTDLGALDKQERLTPLGWHLARLPLTPRGGKLLILGALFSCLDPVAAVAAGWAFKEPFVCPIGKEKDAAKAKILLTNGEPSDHFALYQAITRWENIIEQEPMMAQDFVYRNFLSKNTLYMLRDMRGQFAQNMHEMGFIAQPDMSASEVNTNSWNRSLFKALIAASLFPNIASIRLKVKRRSTSMIVRRADGRVCIHPSSVLGNQMAIHECVGTAHYLVYTLLQRSTGLFIFDVTAVHALPLVFFCNDIVIKEDGPDHCILSAILVKEDHYFLNWRASKRTTALISQLRSELHCLLARHVLNPQPLSQSTEDVTILKALVELITAEDDPEAYRKQDEEEDEDDDVVYVPT